MLRAKRAFIVDRWSRHHEVPSWLEVDDDEAIGRLWDELQQSVGFMDGLNWGEEVIELEEFDEAILPAVSLHTWWARFRFSGGFSGWWARVLARSEGWKIENDLWWTRAPDPADVGILDSAVGFYHQQDSDEGLAGPYVRTAKQALAYDRHCLYGDGKDIASAADLERS